MSAMHTHPRFFIVGCPRSGTTLLQSVLSAHPEVRVPPETWFFSSPRVAQLDTPLTDEEIDRLEETIAAQCKLQDAEVDFAALKRDLRQTDRRPIRALQLALQQFTERAGGSISGEKTPHHLWSVERILQDLPETKIIVIVRDPRGVVASLLRVPWNLDSPRYAVWRWLKDARETHRLRRLLGKEQIVIVRYEDLLERTEQVVRDLCGFLEIDMHPAMLEHNATPTALNFAPHEKSWKSNVGRPIEKSFSTKWAETLEPADAIFIEIVTRTWRKRLGYAVEARRPAWQRARAWASLGRQALNRIRLKCCRRLGSPADSPPETGGGSQAQEGRESAN